MSAVPRQSMRLATPRRLALYIVGGGVWLSGGMWLLFHYFFVEPGDFGPRTNPLEPWWLKLHGAFAFAAVWMFGLVWGVHVDRAWPVNRRRWSGSVTAGVIAVLTLSGYLLYYTGNEAVRAVTSILHWSIGLAFPIMFLWHRIPRRPIKTLARGSTSSGASSGPP